MPETTISATAGWFPAFTALVAFVTGAILESLRDRRTSKREREAAEATRAREREAREAARRGQRFERRTNFQRQTLLDLQEAVMKVVRVTGEMNQQDEMAFRATGEWQKEKFGEEVSNRAYAANRETLMFGVRVRDESVRNLVNELRDVSTSVMICGSREKADPHRQFPLLR